MKLWKILLATMIALVLVCAVATAECAHDWKSKGTGEYKYEKYDANEHTKVGKDYQFCTKCGEERTIDTKITYIDHEMSIITDEVPTCTAEGKIVKKCLYCPHTETTEYDKVDHEFTEFVKHVDPTCEENGYDVYKCENCAETKNYNSTASKNQATGHSPVVTYTAGTCQTKAKDVTACQWCNKVFSTVEYAKADCSYEVKGTVAPTCDEDGYNVYLCKWCGDEKHWDVKPAKHTWVAGDKVEPTCTEKGYTNYACSACGETAKFDYKDAAHKPVIHEYKAATCNEPGHNKYLSCSACSDLWTAAGSPITSIPVIEPDSSMHEYNEYNGWTVSKAPTCTKNGEEYILCIHCNHKKTRVIETIGHDYDSVSKLQAKPAGTVSGVGYVTTPSTCTTAGSGWLECKACHEMTKQVTIPAHDHAWGAWTYSNPATCTTDMTATRKCGWNPAHTETKVVAKATGHAWMVLTGTEPTCDKDGKVTRYCPVCDTKEADKKLAALGCDYSKVVETVAPTCTEDGYTVVTCVRCAKDTKKVDYKDELGHKYEWEHAVKPSMAGDGKDVYICQVCDHIADTKVIKYTKWYYNNTMTSFGPTTKELVGGNDWYRVTPIDVTVDGVYTYDLIASNRYVVGSVTITVNAGVLTVSYDVAASHIDVKDEAMYIYASKADLAAGTAVTANVGAAINVAETFGDDAKVIVSLVLTGDYNAAGNNVSSMIIDDAEIAAMIANID